MKSVSMRDGYVAVPIQEGSVSGSRVGGRGRRAAMLAISAAGILGILLSLHLVASSNESSFNSLCLGRLSGG